MAGYDSERQRFEGFREKLEPLIDTLLRKRDIAFDHIESRTKSLESYRKKIEAGQGRYSDPLTELTDLCGIRVIVNYVEDIELVRTLLTAEFDVDDANSVDKRSEHAYNEFGYDSLHLVISLKPPRSDLPEWEGLGDLKAEVQIRTVVQHAWAAVDHALVYKSDDLIPERLRRRLASVSALLRQADQEFSACRQLRTELRVEYDERITEGDLSEPIHRLSIDAYAHSAEYMDRVVLAAESAGYTIEESNAARVQVGVITALANSGISTLAELDALLRSNATLDEDMAWYLAAYLKMPEHEWFVAREKRGNTTRAGVLFYAVMLTLVGRQKDYMSFALTAGKLFSARRDE